MPFCAMLVHGANQQPTRSIASTPTASAARTSAEEPLRLSVPAQAETESGRWVAGQLLVPPGKPDGQICWIPACAGMTGKRATYGPIFNAGLLRMNSFDHATTEEGRLVVLRRV